MRITNKHNWPDAILRAVQNDDYDRGECDYTNSELLSPPRILALKKKHKDEIEVDVEDMIYALEGKIIHKLLENANRSGLVEKRFYAEIGGKKISAQIDTLAWENVPIEKKIDGHAVIDAEWVLSDFKYTTRYKLQPNRLDADWAFQLNLQGYLIKKNGLEVDRLQIVGIAKDHSKIKAETDPKFFPKKAVTRVPIPMWTFKQVETAVEERIEAHEKAKKELPKCTGDEHWGYKRCAHYCNVNKFCDQWKAKQEKEQ